MDVLEARLSSAGKRALIFSGIARDAYSVVEVIFVVPGCTENLIAEVS